MSTKYSELLFEGIPVPQNGSDFLSFDINFKSLLKSIEYGLIQKDMQAIMRQKVEDAHEFETPTLVSLLTDEPVSCINAAAIDETHPWVTEMVEFTKLPVNKCLSKTRSARRLHKLRIMSRISILRNKFGILIPLMPSVALSRLETDRLSLPKIYQKIAAAFASDDVVNLLGIYKHQEKLSHEILFSRPAYEKNFKTLKQLITQLDDIFQDRFNRPMELNDSYILAILSTVKQQIWVKRVALNVDSWNISTVETILGYKDQPLIV